MHLDNSGVISGWECSVEKGIFRYKFHILKTQHKFGGYCQYLVPAFIENIKQNIIMADPDTLIKAKIHYFAREKYYHSMQVGIPWPLPI